jgi:hypothetical protein
MVLCRASASAVFAVPPRASHCGGLPQRIWQRFFGAGATEFYSTLGRSLEVVLLLDCRHRGLVHDKDRKKGNLVAPEPGGTASALAAGAGGP